MKKLSSCGKKSKSTIAGVRFQPGEKILCYQGPHIYEAKCLDQRKSSHDQRNLEFLVHYRGWKSKYDEWVPPDRILKYTRENLQLQQKLRAPRNRDERKKFKKKLLQDQISASNDNKKAARKDGLKKSDSFDSASSTSVVTHHRHHHHLNISDIKNIEVPPLVERPDDFLAKNEVKIRIPEDLKTILTDDWELVTNQNKLVHLPFRLNIDKILNDYFFHKSQVSKLPLNHTMNGYVDFLSGIRQYFNYFLDKCLLYPSEREQMEYLRQNFRELTSDLSANADVGGKESRRLAKRLKTMNTNNKPNGMKQTVSGKSLPASSTATGSSAFLVMDNNSQSETSDSGGSELVSSEQSANSKVVDFTKLYGAVHLLRLFTKLPQFLFHSDLDAERLATLNGYIGDFLRYLSKNLWIFSTESDTSYIDANLFASSTNKI